MVRRDRIENRVASLINSFKKLTAFAEIEYLDFLILQARLLFELAEVVVVLSIAATDGLTEELA